VEILMGYNPKVIRILSRDENKQFDMQHELNNEDMLRFLIGDVRDYSRIEKACRGADIIFHLAAMKHVTSSEYDTFEAVKTNVLGTQNIIQAAIQCRVKRVVFTSSDKAISPTNAMGATKLLAERLIATANYNQGPIDTIFSVVRFGNVMGSRGSVIPLFIKQIRNQKRITLTNGEMTRFMMSITDAAVLTMKAAMMAEGGEIFVLKMPVIKLSDLSEVVVDEVCKKYAVSFDDVTVDNIGLRFGEKMYEELMTGEEARFAYELPEMYAITQPYYGKKYKKYEQYENAVIKTYTSHDQEAISKEDVRKLILSESLI
jgi:FlaA1/EpsC-like NDP-sugar epimerase